MKQTKLKRFKRILPILVLITITIICCPVLKCSNVFNTTTDTKQQITPVKVERPHTPAIAKVDSTKIIQDSIKEELINEVTEYLYSQSPRAHKFIPKYLVIAGLKNNIDICFMMAQTQLETNFGTRGVGRETSRRSLFGVSVRRYGDYESAINDYCALLKKSYLTKGKTEHHLMTKYVTIRGGRYASNPNYEKELKSAYKNIVAKTRITELQKKWKEFSREKDNETS